MQNSEAVASEFFLSLFWAFSAVPGVANDTDIPYSITQIVFFVFFAR